MGSDETVVRFGGFELQARERRLLSGSRPLCVGPRAFDLLVALVERAGHLVTKDELLELVWPKLVVEESNLHVHVSALRKLLGPEAIATAAGQGYQFTLDCERVPAASALPPVVPTHNLREPVTSFVGRTRELAEIGTLLGNHRLLTLLGMGGVGKTRLALRLASEVVHSYPEGVWFVELAPLADPRLVPRTVASVLGVKEDAGRPVVDALMRFVKDRRLLLILDNCEHLAPACAELARQLLRSGPQVKILATSRDYLHVTGETTYPVQPLGVPGQQTDKVLVMMQSEAMQLFADRAVAAHSAFHVTPQNAPAIAAICRHLEGIPLAIELAAARVRALSVQKIAERLGDRFRLLTGGDEAALPRRQTLHACIDWSYELLMERERVLLRRLSVFAGGWTLEAAEAVGASGEVGASDVLDLLTRLVEKSLVVLEADGERYQMLETVRAYAQERLSDSGEGDDVCARHLVHFLAQAEVAQPMLDGPAGSAYLARLDPERANLLAAHAWCGRTEEEVEIGLRLAIATRRYWFFRGTMEFGYRVIADALARRPASRSSPARCRAFAFAGQFAVASGRYADAREYLEQGLAMARELQNEELAVRPLALLGLTATSQGSHAEARRYLEEALGLARRLTDSDQLDTVLACMAELSRLEGNLADAQSLLEEGLAHARFKGSGTDTAVLLVNLAAVLIGRRSGERARQVLLDVLAIAEETGSKVFGQGVMEASAGLAALLGEWACAARLFGAAEFQMGQLGMQRESVDEAFLMPLMAETRGAIGEAGFDAAAIAGRALSYEDALAETRTWLESRSRLRAAG